KSDKLSKKISPLEFIWFFRQKGIIGHLVLLFLFYSGIIGILTMVKPYLVDLGYDVKDIGFISGIFGTACGALMTIPAGVFIRKVGLHRAVWVFPAVNLTAALSFFGLTYTNHPLVLIYVAVSILWAAY